MREIPSLEDARQFYKSLGMSFEIAYLTVLEKLTRSNKQQYIEAYEPNLAVKNNLVDFCLHYQKKD